jgi:hypothetical protein
MFKKGQTNFTFEVPNRAKLQFAFGTAARRSLGEM